MKLNYFLFVQFSFKQKLMFIYLYLCILIYRNINESKNIQLR